jgi:hypothetical protein
MTNKSKVTADELSMDNQLQRLTKISIIIKSPIELNMRKRGKNFFPRLRL